MLMAVLLTACVSNRITANLAENSGDPSIPSVMYPVTTEQADKILIKSMVAEFGEVDLISVAAPYKGYTLKVSWLLDTHNFTARMLPAEGIRQDGSIVKGFSFEVRDWGSLPTRGNATARELLEKIQSNADEVSKPLPIREKPRKSIE